MIKKCLLSLLVVFQLLMLTGCWGARTAIDQTLVTSIGIDYKEDKYFVTIQALNFSNIAKQEGGQQQEPLPPLIGQASAKSLQAAFDKIERKSPMPLYYGHVNSIILSKSIIESKMDSINSYINGKPLLRYTIWIFGTDRDMKEILSTVSFFNLPFLNTVISNPNEPSRESIVSLSLKFNQLISKYHQPVGALLIPLLDVDDKEFMEEEPSKIAFINGAYVISQQKYRGKVSYKEIKSINWLHQENFTIPLVLEKDNINLDIRSSKASIKVITGEKKPKYTINVRPVFAVIQNENNVNIKSMKSKISKKIKKEIVRTIKRGEELHADLLNISEKSYRYHSKEWDTKTINAFNLDSLNDIKVDVNIIGSKSYKR